MVLNRMRAPKPPDGSLKGGAIRFSAPTLTRRSAFRDVDRPLLTLLEPAWLHFRALPAFVWVEVEPTAAEVDGDLEVLRVAEPTGGLLDALDDGVHGFQAR